MTQGYEVEAKFTCSRRIAPNAITVLLEGQGLQLHWAPPQRQQDSYFDTRESHLLKAGSALRIRRLGKQLVGTFKGPNTKDDVVFAREEIAWNLTEDEVRRLDQGERFSLPSKVLSASGLNARLLQRVLTVETLRQVAVIEDKKKFSAELALDETTFQGPRGRAQQRELELELKAGDPALLKMIADTLGKHFSLQPSRKSKFATGMERVG